MTRKENNQKMSGQYIWAGGTRRTGYKKTRISKKQRNKILKGKSK